MGLYIANWEGKSTLRKLLEPKKTCLKGWKIETLAHKGTIPISSCQLLVFERGGFNKMLWYFYPDVWGDEFNLSIGFKWLISTTRCSRWVPYDRFQWSYDPYKWLYKWLTGVITHYCKIFRSYNYIIPSIRSLILGGPALKVFLEPHPIRNSQDRRAVELDSDEENSEVPWRSDTPLGGSSYEL